MNFSRSLATRRSLSLSIVLFFAIAFLGGTATAVVAQDGRDRIAAAATAVNHKVIDWRRDIHENPELGNREFRTAKKVEEHLRKLGLTDIKTGVAHTGVTALLVGGKPGPVVALRADMDALPVTEKVDLPFASHARTEYNGQEVGVMHACGHDNHVAILMGAAEVLASMKADIPGTIKFIFQPAEEGPPAGEDGGASMMIKEGVLADPRPEAIFGLHVGPLPAGLLSVRPGGAMAAADGLTIKVEGVQTHGSSPWGGIDPIAVSAQIINAIQYIPSRQLDVTAGPAVITIGSIHGGVRGNIIPDSVEMVGTIRTFDTNMRADLLKRLESTVTSIAESWGAKATVTINGYAPVVHNDPALTEQMTPTLRWAAPSPAMVVSSPRIMGSEDFAFFVEDLPGMYFSLGVNDAGVGFGEAAVNHSPYFFANETALITGVRAMAGLAWDFLNK